MMRTRQQQPTRLASDRLVKLENARAELAVATTTAQRLNASFVVVRDEAKKLRKDLARLTVETSANLPLRKDNDHLRSDLQ